MPAETAKTTIPVVPPIDWASPLTLADQVAAELAGEIERGAYPPGTRLPEATELAQRFEVSLSTVTRAIRKLREAGLLASRGRRGMIVLPRAGLPPGVAAPPCRPDRAQNEDEH
jgi:GntR family transcriptional regulator